MGWVKDAAFICNASHVLGLRIIVFNEGITCCGPQGISGSHNVGLVKMTIIATPSFLESLAMEPSLLIDRAPSRMTFRVHGCGSLGVPAAFPFPPVLLLPHPYPPFSLLLSARHHRLGSPSLIGGLVVIGSGRLLDLRFSLGLLLWHLGLFLPFRLVVLFVLS
jgi:hypothetical protein